MKKVQVSKRMSHVEYFTNEMTSYELRRKENTEEEEEENGAS